LKGFIRTGLPQRAHINISASVMLVAPLYLRNPNFVGDVLRHSSHLSFSKFSCFASQNANRGVLKALNQFFQLKMIFWKNELHCAAFWFKLQMQRAMMIA
jgi:hypothetical protein